MPKLDRDENLNSDQIISKWKAIGSVLLAVLGYVASSIVGYSIAESINKALAQLGGVVFGTIFTSVVIYKTRHSVPSFRLSRESFRVSEWLWPLIGGALFKFIEIVVLFYMFQKEIPKDPNLIDHINQPIYLFLCFVIICLWVPILEETIFRAIVIERLLLLTPLAYLMSVLIFESVHFFKLPILPVILVTILYYKKRTIISTIAFHVGLNTVLFICGWILYARV